MPNHMSDRKSTVSRAASAWLRSPVFKVALTLCLLLFIGTSAVFVYYYSYYSKIIDRKLNGEIFKNTARVYAAPYHVYPGQRLTLETTVARLQRAGLEPTGSASADDGVYELGANRVTPGTHHALEDCQ